MRTYKQIKIYFKDIKKKLNLKYSLRGIDTARWDKKELILTCDNVYSYVISKKEFRKKLNISEDPDIHIGFNILGMKYIYYTVEVKK